MESTRTVFTDDQATVKPEAITSEAQPAARLPSRAPSFSRALISRIVGLVAALGLALLVAMVWQGIASTEEAVRQEISETLNRAVERLRILIRAAEMTAESAERAARTPEVTGATLRSTLEISLAAFEQRPELSYLGIALPETGEYGTLERTAAGAIWLWLFPGTRADDPVTRIYILTDHGFVLHEERPADGYDPRSRPFYQAALNSPAGDTWMTTYQWVVHAANSEPLWGFSYVKALRDHSGRLLSVLDTDFDMPALNSFLKSVAAEYASKFQVVELGATPRLIGDPAAGRAPLPVPAELAPLIEFPGTVFVDRMELDGERRWVAARRMDLKGGVSWLVIASRKDPFIEAPLRRQLYQVVGMGSAIAAGLVLISARMARRFGKPLAELERRVAGFGQDDLEAPAATTTCAADGFRETQLLGASFSRMATAVRERERELTEQNSRLRAADARLRVLFERSPAANCLIRGRDGALVDLNSAAERLLELERESHRGKTLMELGIMLEVPQPGEGFGRSADGVERVVLHTRGGRKLHCVAAVSTVEVDGEACRLWAAIDITAQVLAREQELASLALKGAVFDSTNRAIFSLDHRLAVIEWNAAAERLFGLGRDQVLGRGVTEVVFAPDGPADWAAILATTGTATFRFTGAQGPFDAELRLVAFKQNGLEVRTLFLNDISERKRADAALRESLARFHAAARATGDVVWDWDLASNAIWWNENFQILFGYAEEEIEPTIESWTRRIHPDDYDRVTAHIHAIIEGTEEAWSDEYRFRRKDGSYADIFDRGHVLRDESGRGVRMVGAMQDITERKQAQARLLAFNAELEQRVAHRTRELQNLNHELESFCHSVSHDLRAPLRAIAGFTEILAKNYSGTLDDRGQDYLGRVLAATHRMGELIDDLLNLSRVSRDEMRRETVDLSAIAREILANLQHTEPERRVEVAVEDGLTAVGDGRLLRVMLENLLGNAWKFTSKTPAARIAFAASNEDGKPCFAVSDNGAGFDMRYADKLFGPFQRLHRAAEFPGTGIGLATVQRIVARHGGHISAQAEPGKGATFRFSFG